MGKIYDNILLQSRYYTIGALDASNAATHQPHLAELIHWLAGDPSGHTSPSELAMLVPSRLV